MKYKFIILSLIALLTLVSCAREADIASRNLSNSADNFEINRRIVFFNGITDKYILVIEGLCSLGNNDTTGRLSVTCKIGPSLYKKHFLGLSDNVSFFSEQIESAHANPYHYTVMFSPSSIVPDVQMR